MIRSRKISAVILAAGYSRRMERFKPLLPLGGMTVLERVVSLYEITGVTDIRVVTGFRSDKIRSALAARPVSVVHNPVHDSGMFSSVMAGVNSLPEGVRAFFVHPVDIPLVRPHTLALLMDAFNENPSPVIYPAFDDRRGHPPLVHGELRKEIVSHDGTGGLRALLRRFDSRALDLPLADEGVLLDMDTPNDFQRLSTRIKRSDILTENEGRVLMEKVRSLPGPVIDHCRQVARVAEALAAAVTGGCAIDLPLVRSAARVHDAARLEKNHAAAGSRLLREMGFPSLADIIAVHMDMDVCENAPLDEAQIVHLADKLVAGDTVVGLPRRFAAKLTKYGLDPKVYEKISRRRRTAFSIQEKVESAAGEKMHRILEKAGLTGERQP